MGAVDKFIASVGLGMAKKMTNRAGYAVRSQVVEGPAGWELSLEGLRDTETGTRVFNISATTGAIPVIRAEEEEIESGDALEGELQDIMEELWPRFVDQMIKVELR